MRRRVVLAAIGDADRRVHRPMQTDSLSWIASMSKPIAATAVMMMVDEGKVRIDDPVEKHLPEFKGQRVIAEKDADHVLLKKPKRPRVLVPLKPGKTDPAKIGPLIEKLGLRMLSDNDSSAAEKAARALSLIDDPRVVSWYVKVMEKGTATGRLMPAALDRLSRLKGDAALEGIKLGLRPQANDRNNDRIHHFAAEALLRSRHPEARKTLLSLWNHPYAEVRFVVIHALREMETPESTALLEKTSRDSAKHVREFAQMVLHSRTEKAKTPAK